MKYSPYVVVPIRFVQTPPVRCSATLAQKGNTPAQQQQSSWPAGTEQHQTVKVLPIACFKHKKTSAPVKMAMAMQIRHIKGYKYVLAPAVNSSCVQHNQHAQHNQSCTCMTKPVLVCLCSGRITGSLSAHPEVPGQLFYVVGSSVVTMFEVRAQHSLRINACKLHFYGHTFHLGDGFFCQLTHNTSC